MQIQRMDLWVQAHVPRVKQRAAGDLLHSEGAELCVWDGLEGEDGAGGRQAREEGDVCILTAESAITDVYDYSCIVTYRRNQNNVAKQLSSN